MSQLTLGIETSCDETGVAVYSDNKGILTNSIFSQIELHKDYGGVVPELASRSQLEKIGFVTRQALQTAGKKLDEIDIVAVTNRPGLPGSLLVGVCFAKALAWAQQKKIIGINHLEGHVFSSFLEFSPPFPHLCLTASGGHTSLCLVNNFGDYETLGQTLDDAAGEAFDKIAKLLGLPYPGGPVIEKLAREVEFQDFFHYPRGKDDTLNFSFSGLKTAVLYDLVKKEAYNLANKTMTTHMTDVLKVEVASSLLVAIKDIFIRKLARAVRQHPDVQAVTFVGGVACNKYIKRSMDEFCKQNNKRFFSPSPQFCTDNGGMIAFVGNYKAQQGKFSDYTLDIF